MTSWKSANPTRSCDIRFFFILLAGVVMSYSQQVTPPDTSANRTEVDAVLKNYEKAYEAGNYEGVKKVWPNLDGDAKESKKLKARLGRADLIETKLGLEIQEIHFTLNGIMATAERHEQYVQLERSDYYAGDNMMGRMPTQTPGPSADLAKKTIHKNGRVWIRFHRDGKDLVIESISDKKPAD